MPIDNTKLKEKLTTIIGQIVGRDHDPDNYWLKLGLNRTNVLTFINKTIALCDRNKVTEDYFTKVSEASAKWGASKTPASVIINSKQFEKILAECTVPVPVPEPERRARKGVTFGDREIQEYDPSSSITDSAPPTPPVATPPETPPRTPTITTSGSAGGFGEDRSTRWLREMEKEKEQMKSYREQKTALDQRVDAASRSVDALESRVQKALEDRLSRIDVSHDSPKHLKAELLLQKQTFMESISKAESLVLGIQSRASRMVADESPYLRPTLDGLTYLLPQFEERLVSFERLIKQGQELIAGYEDKTRQMPATEERRAQCKKQAHEAIEAFRAQIITPFLGKPPSELHAKNVSRILSPWVAKCAEIQKLLASNRFDEVQRQSQELTTWVTKHSSNIELLACRDSTPDHGPAFTAYSRDISRIGAGDIGMRTLDTGDFSTISEQRRAVTEIIKAISEPEGPPATRSSHRPR